ncbi:MAG: HD-GYP domain-containing protein, partial [bacterium]
MQNIEKYNPFTKDLQNIPRFAAAHHEMLDGSGYPRGLKGDEIPLCGKIMAVCDIYDALTASDSPYKKAMPVEKSL